MIMFFLILLTVSVSAQEENQNQRWIKAMASARRQSFLMSDRLAEKMWRDYPQMTDWFLQDNTTHQGFGYREGFDSRGDFRNWIRKGRSSKLEQKLITKVAKDLGITVEIPKLKAGDSQYLEIYADLCSRRRIKRLQTLLSKTDKIIYATHHNMGDIYLATETQGCPDGSQLRIIDLSPLKEGKPIKDELLFDSNNGIVRDPELSFDGKRLLFAWRKTNKTNNTTGAIAPETGNYKIYEMELATREIRQLTDDSTYNADFDPCYLPNGEIMFSSARIVQEVTCGWGDCSNLYIMNKDGKYARRVGFDQTQTGFPHLLDDGRVVFTRRDYNDRGQTYAHALFVMNPDGTNQTEFYGNNTSEPTSLQHARPIPGTGKVIAIAGGYHTSQGGKLTLIDIKKGQQDYQGIEFVNWDFTKRITHNDSYGREGEQYSYPYPITDDSFLISFAPIGGYLMNKTGRLHNGKEQGLMRYKLYYMNLNGERELLAASSTLSCAQPIPVVARQIPTTKPSAVDYTKNKGIMYVQDVYYGPSIEGVERGTVKKIRVSKIFYKPVSIGGACWAPPWGEIGPGKKYSSFGQHSVTPVGVGTASFDAKEIIGEVDVHEDGSAMFEVPAREPIYLQLIDENNHVVQSMRSWATLMPGENFSCVGCHEENNDVPQSKQKTTALSNPPQQLQDFAGVSGRPFSYAKMVQPIWNDNCVSCHSEGKKAAKFDLSDTIVTDVTSEQGWESTRRRFYKSYLTLLDADKRRDWQHRLDVGTPNKWVDYYTRLLTVELIPPYYAGSAKSGLLKLLKKGHQGVSLTETELAIVSAWMDLNVPFVGEYDEMNDWDDKAKELYRAKTAIRTRMEEIEKKNIADFIKDGQ